MHSIPISDSNHIQLEYPLSLILLSPHNSIFLWYFSVILSDRMNFPPPHSNGSKQIVIIGLQSSFSSRELSCLSGKTMTPSLLSLLIFFLSSISSSLLHLPFESSSYSNESHLFNWLMFELSLSSLRILRPSSPSTSHRRKRSSSEEPSLTPTQIQERASRKAILHRRVSFQVLYPSPLNR